MFEPLAAKRFVVVRERRTSADYAHGVQWLCEQIYPHADEQIYPHADEQIYPHAEKIILVQDNLNTHGEHSLYQALAPEVARRLCERIEWHFTPKHGSWLNMAELELSVLSRQCLQERMESQDNRARHVKAWQDNRNQAQATVNWHFTTQDARTKLRHLYPQVLAS